MSHDKGGNKGEPEVVSGRALSVVIRRFIVDWLRERPKGHQPVGIAHADLEEADHFIGPVQYIAEHSGLSLRQCQRISNGDMEWVGLHTADKVLTAINLDHLLQTGELSVVKSPRWSAEKWAAYMKERGCW